MNLFFLAACLVLTPSAPVTASPVDTQFVQVHPQLARSARFERSPGQGRAVVLLHGLTLHLHREKGAQAHLRDWQRPGSKLVQALASEGDVYAIAYGQNVPVDAVAEAPALRAGLRRLRAAGYAEVVLLGHSAGGLIARRLVEDHPALGVTKVIQVCTPNGGCSLAKLDWLCHAQRAFVESLGKAARRQVLRTRGPRTIPEGVQFVCVIGTAAGLGDFVVSDAAQWPKDLRDQGVPAVRFWTGHFWVTRNRADARKLAELVRAEHPRWDAARVAALKKTILGD